MLPEYQHQGIGTELLDQFDEYFKQVDRIVIVTTNEAMAAFYEHAGFKRGSDTKVATFVRPRKLLEPKF